MYQLKKQVAIKSTFYKLKATPKSVALKKFLYRTGEKYFDGHDYNLTQIAAMVNDEEPSPQRIAMLVNIAKQNNVKVVFTEPQYDPKYMQSVASQTDGQVVYVNDLDQNYLQNMENVAKAFSKA